MQTLLWHKLPRALRIVTIASFYLHLSRANTSDDLASLGESEQVSIHIHGNYESSTRIQGLDSPAWRCPEGSPYVGHDSLARVTANGTMVKRKLTSTVSLSPKARRNTSCFACADVCQSRQQQHEPKEQKTR